MKYYYETKGFKGILTAKDEERAEDKIAERHGQDEARDVYVLREATESDLKSIKL